MPAESRRFSKGQYLRILLSSLGLRGYAETVGCFYIYYSIIFFNQPLREGENNARRIQTIFERSVFANFAFIPWTARIRGNRGLFLYSLLTFFSICLGWKEKIMPAESRRFSKGQYLRILLSSLGLRGYAETAGCFYIHYSIIFFALPQEEWGNNARRIPAIFERSIFANFVFIPWAARIRGSRGLFLHLLLNHLFQSASGGMGK
jgi:hypothetical protein